MGSARGRLRFVAGRTGLGGFVTVTQAMRPYVAVVILHWGATATTARCLQSLRGASWPGRRTVLIVDNTRRLDEDASARAAPLEIEILRPERNLGFCDGCTLGLSSAIDKGAAFVLLLNNDVVVAPNFFGPLLAAAREAPDAGLLSPQIVHLRHPESAWYQGGTFSLWSGIPVQGHRRRAMPLDRPPREVDYATGCAMLVRQDLIRRVGSFDGRLFAYCEDLDLSIRARQAGYRVLFVPASLVYHDVTDEPGRASLRIYYSTRNLMEVMRKHASWYKWFSFSVNFSARWLGFFALLALLQRRPGYLTALLRGITDFARRRLGQSTRIDDGRADRTSGRWPDEYP
jgi:GT2 family glycosyltransferase